MNVTKTARGFEIVYHPVYPPDGQSARRENPPHP